MIAMPVEYKRSMSQQLRNRSYMSVSIGVINQTAQSGASISTDYGAEYSYLSNFKKLLDNYDTEMEYATLEENFFETNGSMLFPPRNKSDGLYNVGTIAEPIGGSIVIAFDNIYDIRGLTIDFGEKYPVDFTISNGNKTVNFVGNEKSYWTTEEIFDETSYLIITPVQMVNGNGRLRIHKMIMGIGIAFTNEEIVKAEKNEYVSPISEELPTLDFTLEVENYDYAFDVENDESVINYLENGQEVSVKYGYDVLGDGEITWMDGCTCVLSDWEADDTSMSFTAKDRIDLLEDVYYGGLYRPEGITLYDLAVDVLTDAGLDEREYELDEYLQKVTVVNPMPCVTHKECLQIIANAGRCKVYVDRLGKICVKANFVTVLSPERMTVESQDATDWSDLDSVIAKQNQYEYATFSQNQFRTNGSMYFLPRDSNYLTAGFISSSTSDENGEFEQNPKVKVILEAATTYFGIGISFSANPVRELIIHTYYHGELQDSYNPEMEYGYENTIEHEFSLFDTIEIEFTKAQPNSRVFLSEISFGDITDYRMSYDVMTKFPKGKKIEKVSRIDVIQNIYGENPDESDIFQETIDVSGLDSYTFYFSYATYDVSVKADGELVSILDSSSYFVEIDVSELSGEKEFIVTGREYIITNKVRSKTINSTGKIEEWDNPLISTAELADLQAEWLRNYFANNIEYDISYRGEPRIDSGDILFFETKNHGDIQIQVYEHTISFNGALSGTVKARRAVAQNG